MLGYTMSMFIDPEKIDFDRTDTTLYHGAGLTEEIAALLAVSFGVRIKAGGDTRIFQPGDPKGRPQALSRYLSPLILPQPPLGAMLPGFRGRSVRLGRVGTA